MAQDKKIQINIDNSDPTAYPDAQIRDNDGSDNGTPVARITMSDQFEFFAKLMRLAGLSFNNQYDNETNGYQYVQAAIALAGKNDYVYTLNSALITPSVGSPFQAVTIDTNLAILNLNEMLVAKASVDFASEAFILKAGTITPVKAIASSNSYKAGDYVLLINTAGGIAMLQLATGSSISQMGLAANFLKAATDGQTIDGTITDAAVTPASFLAAFIDHVNGAGSNTYLASASQNGLLSIAQYNAIAAFASPIKNVGYFSGLDVGTGSPGQTYAHGGDVVSAVLESGDSTESVVIITVANNMTGNNYFVRTSIQSEGSIGLDNDIDCPVFKPISPNSFRWSIKQNIVSTQSIKVHLEVVQIS